MRVIFYSQVASVHDEMHFLRGSARIRTKFSGKSTALGFIGYLLRFKLPHPVIDCLLWPAVNFWRSIALVVVLDRSKMSGRLLIYFSTAWPSKVAAILLAFEAMKS